MICGKIECIINDIDFIQQEGQQERGHREEDDGRHILHEET